MAKSQRFRSKFDAMNRRKLVWTCLTCGFQHIKDQNCTGKPGFCTDCGSNKIQFFASAAEAKRYAELRLMEKAGMIRKGTINCQSKFPCIVNGMKITEYRADFEYKDAQGNIITEDVKPEGKAGFSTDLFKFKKKLVEALYPDTTIKIVRR